MHVLWNPPSGQILTLDFPLSFLPKGKRALNLLKSAPQGERLMSTR